ncbi:MAG: hypothetical protein ACXWNK_13745 [Vulcanimicrobiaceae bacterium]
MSHVRLVALTSMMLALSACGGGGAGNILGNTIVECNPGTQVQLANPSPGQSNVDPNIGSVTVVANGNNNTLYTTYQGWNLLLVDTFTHQTVNGGQLNLVADPNGPHPYGSDFYYQASIPQLQSGQNWSVELVQSQSFASCSPYPLNSFST